MKYIDVDTAVELEVNIVALTDNGDFISQETGVVYNAAGMALKWNFITTAGVVTQTAVTPTTAGDYDWGNLGGAMYKIEVPATGGASINNDTEGFGRFTGICNGVLSWVGPTYCFRSAALNNSLIDSGGEIALEASVQTLLDASLDLTSDRGTLLADGTEQIVFEFAAPTKEWVPDNINIDLSNMAAGDIVTVKTYIKFKSGGSYVEMDAEVYSNAQTIPGIVATGFPNRYGYKITLQQSAPTYRNFDWERFNLG